MIVLVSPPVEGRDCSKSDEVQSPEVYLPITTVLTNECTWL
jgi:hypothetical protein